MKELPPAFRVVPRDVELLAGLVEAFADRPGWVQATGSVSDIELALSANTTEARRAYSGHFTLVALAGPLGGPYGATLSRVVGDGVEVLAGVLVRALSREVHAVCIGSQARHAARDGALTPTQPKVGSPAPFAKPRSPPISGFAARVGSPVGATGAASADEAEAELPERGDLVQHFAFGLCEVLNVVGDRLVLRDAGGAGRTREIAIERLSVTGPSEHAGKRLFLLERR